MKTNLYRIAKKMEHSYWACLNIKDLGNDLYLAPDGIFSIKKNMQTDLKLILNYYRGVKSATNHINWLKKLNSFLFMYKAVTGYKKTFVYKMLITFNNNCFSYDSNILVDNQSNAVADKFHSAMKYLRSLMNRHNSNYKIVASRPRIKYYKNYHVHGLVLSSMHDYQHEAKLMQDYLNRHLSVKTNVRLLPLQNYYKQQPAVLTGYHDESDYQAIRQYLIYINRTRKLAFPNTKHPQQDLNKWNRLANSQKKQYVNGALFSFDGKHAHYNYTYSFKAEYHRVVQSLKIIIKLADVYATLHEIGVVSQQSLMNLRDVDPNLESEYYRYDSFNGSHQHHHYTYAEQWQRAERQQVESNAKRLAEGKERLNKATSTGLNIITPRYDKTATSRTSDGYSQYITTTTATVKSPSWFEKRTTGIPP